MRVAVVTESFLPQVNGVTSSVARIVEHLSLRGHEALILAPGVVHLASPIVLGAHGAVSAWRAGIPAVAVHQTDIVRFAARYGFPYARRALWSWLRYVHGRCAPNLAPSSQAAWDLRRHGIPRVHIWGRGVDGEIFSPRWRTARSAPVGEVPVGYVGRLAPENGSNGWHRWPAIPPVGWSSSATARPAPPLERRLKGAIFLGFQHGQALGQAMASLDIFVHRARTRPSVKPHRRR